MTNNKKPLRFPISIKYSIAALIILLLQNLVILYLETERTRKQAQQDMENEIQLTMTNLQLSLGKLLASNNTGQIQQEINSLGSRPNIKSAYLINDTRHVMASINTDNIGNDIQSILSAKDLSYLSRNISTTASGLKINAYHDRANKKILTLISISTDGAYNLNADNHKTAYLFIVLDTSSFDINLVQAIYTNMFPASILMLATFILLTLLFDLLVNKKLLKLTRAAQNYLGNNKFDIADIPGNDEITDLNKSIHKMVDKINLQHTNLKTNEILLEIGQKLAHVGSWEHDLATRNIKWSAETYRIFGYKPQELPVTYDLFLNSVHPDDKDKVNSTYRSSLDNNDEGYEISHRIVRFNDQQVRHVFEKCLHTRDKSGTITGSIGMVHDITEQVQTELALRRSEARYRSIIDASPVPMSLNDDQRNITYLNAAFTHAFGYSMDDIPTLEDWWPKAYPDIAYRRWVMDTWRQHLDHARNTNSSFEPIELTLRCKSGSDKIVLAEAAALNQIADNLHLVTLYDITDIRKAEAELNKSSALLENIVNSSPDLVVVKDTQLRTIFCNENFARAAGKSRLSMYGKTDIENGWDEYLVKGDPQKGIRGFMQEDLEVVSGKNVHNPYDILTINGKKLIYDTHKITLRDSSNNIIGLLGISRDVTDRYQAMDALIHGEERLRLATEAAGIGIWEWNVRTNIIRWDKQMFNIYGVDPAPDNLIDYQTWCDFVLPQDLAQQEATLLNTVRTRGHSNREFRILRRADKTVRIIQASENIRLDIAGNTEWVIGINRDITELRNSENILRSQKEEQQFILNSMIDAVITIDQQGIVYSYNTAAEVMFGFMAEEVIGKNIKMLMPESTASHHDGYLQHYAESHQTRVLGVGREVIAMRKTGETFPMRLAVADLPMKADGIKYFVGTCSDLSYIKLQEEQLRRSQKMDALGKLTGGIAHDFNNMLGVIMGYSELLKATLSNDSKQTKYVLEIFHAGERAKKLTSKLLAFSRKTAADTEIVDLNKLLLDEQLLLEKTLTARIKLVLNLTRDVWPVLLDKSSLEDAILNMSINAMHAMPDGGIFTITTNNIHLRELDINTLNLPVGDYVLLSLTDTGTGMDEDTRQKIFDPFFTTKGEQGTGLGMSQVYGFVQQSRGTIIVNSEPGEGTTLAVYFPRQQAATFNPATTDNTTVVHKGHGTVLVVDDETALLNLSSEILTAAGYRVLTASRGNIALSILQTEKVDLILSDIVMPGMDGYQLAEQVHDLYPDIKIQLVSGFTTDQVNEKYLDWYNRRLLKPYTSATLLQTVKTALNAPV